IVDQHIQCWIIRDQLFRDRRYVRWVCNIQFDGIHSWIRLSCGIEMFFAAARDDDFVAELVQRFGETMADSCAPACDEDGVVCELHRDSLDLSWIKKLVR